MVRDRNLYIKIDHGEKEIVSSPLLNISKLTEDEFNIELEKGYSSMLNGDVFPAKEAFTLLRGELGI